MKLKLASCEENLFLSVWIRRRKVKRGGGKSNVLNRSGGENAWELREAMVTEERYSVSLETIMQKLILFNAWV